MGLLGEIYSFGNRTRNRLKGLLDDPKGYLQQTADQTANTLRDMTGANETAQQFALRDKINAGDQNALAQYRNLEKTIQNKLFDVALNFNPAAVGMTAWHGSPHKFDKFDLSKIGTGEGAQAYGHGAYLGEARATGEEYARMLSGKKAADGSSLNWDDPASVAAMRLSQFGGDAEKAIQWIKTGDVPGYNKAIPMPSEKATGQAAEARNFALEVIDHIKSGKALPNVHQGYLYKTDIPDEAVARFLDWDKPLSQQAPEVQAALKNHPAYGAISNWLNNASKNLPASQEATGSLLHETLSSKLGGQTGVSSVLNEAGIPGIRYLDGGSRAAGQGSSNFVIFDPNMIRILERNGQATGAQPWKPGEWGGLLK